MSTDEFKFSCKHCGQHIAVPNSLRGTQIDCPSCKHHFSIPKSSSIALRITAVVLVIIAVACLNNYIQANARFEKELDSQAGTSGETHSQKEMRWRKEAAESLDKAVPRELVGFTRVVEKQLWDFEDHPTKWTASVTAEFVNSKGGVERTNLPFVFATYSDRVSCLLDVKKISDRRSAEFQEELEKIKLGKN